jgi:hypothetical protein
MISHRVLRSLIISHALLVMTATVAAQSYVVESIKVPDDISLEVGGMGFWPDGTLVMCTRRGEVPQRSIRSLYIWAARAARFADRQTGGTVAHAAG